MNGEDADEKTSVRASTSFPENTAVFLGLSVPFPLPVSQPIRHFLGVFFR